MIGSAIWNCHGSRGLLDCVSHWLSSVSPSVSRAGGTKPSATAPMMRRSTRLSSHLTHPVCARSMRATHFVPSGMISVSEIANWPSFVNFTKGTPTYFSSSSASSLHGLLGSVRAVLCSIFVFAFMAIFLMVFAGSGRRRFLLLQEFRMLLGEAAHHVGELRGAAGFCLIVIT